MDNLLLCRRISNWIEAVYGTDNLIKQSYPFLKEINQYFNKNDKKQDLRVDLPTIGLKTVKNLNRYALRGVAYSSNKTIILNKFEVINYCNKNAIFLFGV